MQGDNAKSKALAERARESLDNVKLHLNNTGSLLEKYETRLAEFNNRVDVAPPNNKAQTDLQVNILRGKLQESNRQVQNGQSKTFRWI